MRRLPSTFACMLALLIWTCTPAQARFKGTLQQNVSLTADVNPDSRSDVCHVYVVDVAQARKAVESFRETGSAEADLKALSKGQTVFPEFRPAKGEEELTTKTYRLPGSSLIITASVYYTDESMASAAGADSMLVGVVMSPQPQPNAITAENNAVSEVTFNDHLDTVRAKKYVRVKGLLYLFGVECHCRERQKAK